MPEVQTLTCCFCYRQLASGSDTSGTWRVDTGSGQQTQQSQQSKADSAPVTSYRPREAPPARSSTAPNMQTLQSVKDTAKLRIEKFKVSMSLNRCLVQANK